MNSKHILVVDDEPSVVEVVGLYLRREGFRVSEAGDGQAALASIAREMPDLLILDVMLPQVDGLEIVSRVRARAEVPIIMLTARREEIDRIVGLELGADDYVVKPFSPRELVSRVRAVLRRTRAVTPAESAPGEQQALTQGEITLNQLTREATVRGAPTGLTAKEFDLLWFFMRHPSVALPHSLPPRSIRVFLSVVALALLAGLGLIWLMIAFAYLASSAVIENATRLAQAAGRVATGDLSARVQVVGRDELARTAETFNYMAAQLESMAHKQRELEQLRRDLIAWTSHDLRTPITSIRVRAEALADGVVDDPAMVARYHQQICSEVQRLSGLIDDLFELARLDAGGQTFDLAPYSLTDVVSDTLESFRLQAEAQGVALDGFCGPGLDPVRMDAQKINRLLSNLLGNALRHTPAGGQVTLHAERQGGQVLVAVQDTGEGIPPEDLPRVFERFFRGERSRTRSRGGAGLGLAIARSIAEGHGGSIEAGSLPGQGTTFTVRWPG
jgi:signal transduction histidine kinase